MVCNTTIIAVDRVAPEGVRVQRGGFTDDGVATVVVTESRITDRSKTVVLDELSVEEGSRILGSL